MNINSDPEILETKLTIYEIILTFATDFLPLSSGKSPAMTAASPVAPAPSTTAFSSSTSRRIAIEIQASETVTLQEICDERKTSVRMINLTYFILGNTTNLSTTHSLSTSGAAVARALTPTVGTVRPSARLG